MPGRKLNGAEAPTPGPWLVRGETEPGASARDSMLGIEPADEAGAGGWPYLIREDRDFAPGDCPLHLATGIQRLADARLMAAAPDLAAVLLRVLTSSALAHADRNSETEEILGAAWALLVRVARHLQVWPEDPSQRRT